MSGSAVAGAAIFPGPDRPDEANDDGAATPAGPPIVEGPAADPLDVLGAQMAAQHQELARLRDEVGRFHQRAGAQENVIDRMQRRIEDLQADQVRALLAPVATELATLHGEVTDIAARAMQSPPPETLGKELGLLARQVETALEKLGMQSAAAAPGVTFDRRWHAAVRLVPTAVGEQDQLIATVLRQGFGPEGAARATVMARVTVYQYDPELALGPADLTEAELNHG